MSGRRSPLPEDFRCCSFNVNITQSSNANHAKGQRRREEGRLLCTCMRKTVCEKGFAKTSSTGMRVFLFTNIPFSVHSDLSSAHKEVCRSLKTEL